MRTASFRSGPPALPALPPPVLMFRGSVDADTQVDPVAGTLRGVALMTAGAPARGWPMFVDERTLDTLIAAFEAIGSVKSYLRHTYGDSDRTGEEIGLWSGYRRAGSVARADFAALAAFRKHEAEDYDKLFELAQKAAASFGVSPVFKYALAWVRKSGEEIACRVARYEWSEERRTAIPCFEPSAPADARHELPSVRVTEGISADFVDRPAANRGLFSAREYWPAADPVVDAAAQGNLPPLIMHKEIFAKFRSQPAQLARAMELHTGDEKLTLAEITATIERETTTAELATLREGVKARETELAALRESVKAKDTEIATLKAQTVKDAETIAAFRKTGSAGVPTGEAPPEGAGAKEMKRADFNKLPADKRSAFFREGGRLVD